MKIYIPNNNIKERKYTIDILFKEFLGIETHIKICQKGETRIILNNKKEIVFEDHFFENFKTEKSYLNEKNIPCKVFFARNKFAPEENIPVIFGTDKLIIEENKIICGNDIFAAIFFMLTRWEENAVKEKDEHGRFPEEKSFVIRNNIQHRPVVNEYLEMIRNMLFEFNCSKDFKTHNYKPVITHDIDFLDRYDTVVKVVKAMVWAFLNKPGIKAPLYELKAYFNVQKRRKPDPFHTFDYLMNISEKYGLKSHFYFIPAVKGEKDYQYDIRKDTVKNIIKKIIARKHFVGVHGSYGAYNKPEKYRLELKRLTQHYSEVKEGRQHFLRFKIPDSLQIWEDNNLETDSSFGFSNAVGFRAGVCYNYSLFNILSQKKLKVKEIPLLFMESVFDKVKSEKEILEKIVSLKKIVHKYNGNYVFLWHNNSFYDFQRRKLSKLYSKIIAEISN